MQVPSHPQRDVIWKELHARPYIRFSGPAHVLHFSFFVGGQENATDGAALLRLPREIPLTPTYETPRHAIYAATIPGLGRLVLSWERHTEFVSYTFFLYELQVPFHAFAPDLDRLVPEEWLEGFGPTLLVATRLCVGSAAEIATSSGGLAELFEGHTVNASSVAAGRATAWSCYRRHRDGFGRIAVVVREMAAQDLGRTVQRLLAIENSYHLTLLPLPLAADVKPELAAAEGRMVLEMDALRKADSLQQKRPVLDALLGLAAEIEHLRARVSNRFAASSAYFSLLESHVAELREEKIDHFLPLSRFLMRRVRPAAQTYRGILERLANLSERIDRAAELLRTSIELHLEEQNARLLEAADRRARLQLRLQEAIENLSVFVVTYYALGLVGYALKGIKARGVEFDLDATLGLALPLLLAAVWTAAYLIRRRFRET